jgi:hypothetical protein
VGKNDFSLSARPILRQKAAPAKRGTYEASVGKKISRTHTYFLPTTLTLNI